MNNNIRVLVDIDDTLNELQSHFIDTVIEMGYDYDLDKCDDYEIQNGIQIDEKDKRAVMAKIFNTPSFWRTIPLIEKAYEGLYYLNTSFDTWIATSPWSEENKKDKLYWVSKKLPFFDVNKVIFSHKKWELDGDIIIEDKPQTIRECNKIGMKTICKFQAYNADEFPNVFMYSWNEIYDIMNSLKEEL